MAALAASTAAHTVGKPNVVVLFADDLSWSDRTLEFGEAAVPRVKRPFFLDLVALAPP